METERGPSTAYLAQKMGRCNRACSLKCQYFGQNLYRNMRQSRYSYLSMLGYDIKTPFVNIRQNLGKLK